MHSTLTLMNRRNLVPIAVISIFSILIHCLFISSDFEFHRDELFYIVLGYHPALGYFDLPPFISYISFILNLTGLNSLFVIRIICALILAVSAFCCYKIALQLSKNIYLGYFAALIFILTPVGLRMGILYQYTSFDLMFWNILMLLFLKWYQTEEIDNANKYLKLFGIVSGIALMNKYMILLLISGLFLGLLLSPKRKMFFKKEVLYAAIIAFIIVLPNLLWQVYYGFPYMLNAKQIYDNQLVNNSASQFIKDQILNYGPAGLFWIIFIVFSFSVKKYRVFLPFTAAFFFVLALLILLKGKSYYSMGLYPALITFGIYFIYDFLKNKKLSIAILSLLFIMTAWLPIRFMTAFIPDQSPNEMPETFKYLAEEKGIESRRWEDGKIHFLPQDYADMLGWKEMAELTQRAYSELTPEEKASTLVFAGNYGIASAVEYYSRTGSDENKITSPIVNSNSSFIQWAPESFPLKNAIVVDDMDSTLYDMFKKVEIVGKFDHPQARESGLFVFKCTEPKINMEEFYYNWRQKAYEKKFRKIF